MTSQEFQTKEISLSVDVAVCTFRRTQLANALRSLAAQQVDASFSFRVIVADNDETPSAKDLVRKLAEETRLPIVYVHAPARNISVARKACLDQAEGDLIAFLDDDEEADPLWLAALVKAWKDGAGDVVLGPVRALYPDAAPAWMKRGDFHSTRPVWVDEEIRTGYTCNVLFDRSHPALKDLQFREELGRCGGEDTAFFDAAFRAGARIGYAAEALVTEKVTSERATFLWLASRRFRSGQTHGTLLLQGGDESLSYRVLQIGKAAGKVLACWAAAPFFFFRPDKTAFWLLRGVMHAGVVCRLLGRRELVQYG